MEPWGGSYGDRMGDIALSAGDPDPLFLGLSVYICGMGCGPLWLVPKWLCRALKCWQVLGCEGPGGWPWALAPAKPQKPCTPLLHSPGFTSGLSGKTKRWGSLWPGPSDLGRTPALVLRTGGSQTHPIPAKQNHRGAGEPPQCSPQHPGLGVGPLDSCSGQGTVPPPTWRLPS